MTKKFLLVFLATFTAPFAAADTPTTVAWSQLARKQVKGGEVRVPGYMVPLEVNGDRVSEFLLIPVLPGCVHIPPPPPEQTVHVTTKADAGIAASIRPVWIEGTLTVKVPTAGADPGGEGSLYELRLTRAWALTDHDLQTLPPVPPQTFDCKGRDRDEAVCQAFKSWQRPAPKRPRSE